MCQSARDRMHLSFDLYMYSFLYFCIKIFSLIIHNITFHRRFTSICIINGLKLLANWVKL